MKVMILGNWATNKGDRAIITFLINQLNEIQTFDRIVVSSTNPDIIKQYFDIPKIEAVPLGYPLIIKNHKNKYMRRIFQKIYFHNLYKRDFPILTKKILGNISRHKIKINEQFYRELSSADICIITGGHHITSMRDPDCLNLITYDIGLALYYKKNYILWSQSLGPLLFRNERNEQYINQILQHANAIFLRDHNSLDELKKINYTSSNVIETYDSVFGLYPYCCKTYSMTRERIAGISVFYSNFVTEYDKVNYISMMGKVCDFIIKNDYKILFFPMESEDYEIELIKQIINRVSLPFACKIENTDVPTVEHISKVSKCDLFIGHKTHSVIFSLISNTPLIALSYHPKTADFMKMYQLDKYVIKEDTFTQEWFQQAFTSLLKEKDTLRENMNKKNLEYSQKVIFDFRNYMEKCTYENN